MEQGNPNFKVPYTTVVAINPHPDADKLEIATIYAFQVVVKKDLYSVGDPVVYIPIDSIISPWLEQELFPMVKEPTTGAWIKPPFSLHGSRVRQVRIRKFASQGMVVDPELIAKKVKLSKLKPEQDLSEALGITKYEPPAPGPVRAFGGKKQPKPRKYAHPLFHQYNGLTNINWLAIPFEPTERVMVQEKTHGTNARASIMPHNAKTFWGKAKKIFGLAPKQDKLYGSNTVDISSKETQYEGFYGEDIYGATFKKLDVFSKLKLGETVYGEIVGPGIQKNYDYSLKEHKFLLFDVKILHRDGTQEWLSPVEVVRFAKERGFDMVPVLHMGFYDKDLIYSMTTGPSVFDPKTPVREGVVVKAMDNYSVHGNKRAYKWLSEKYLDDKNNSDNH